MWTLRPHITDKPEKFSLESVDSALLPLSHFSQRRSQPRSPTAHPDGTPAALQQGGLDACGDCCFQFAARH